MARMTATIDRPLKQNGINQVALALVWLTMASSSLVFVEPAPVDALTLGLMIGLPIVGLLAFPRAAAPIIACGIIIVAMTLVSTATITDDFQIATPEGSDFVASTKHALISTYLMIGGLLLMAFVALRPVAHSQLIMSGVLFAAVFAAITALVGYFQLAGPISEWFVKFDRAAGTFKDPNVLGAYLILPLLAATHLVIHGRGVPRFAGLVSAVLILLAILFTFSRGAWLMTAVALMSYGLLTLLTARTNRQRINILMLAGFGLATGAVMLGAALQTPDINEFFLQRARAFQSYDAGPEGRFGGQLRALDAILLHPFGIGAMQFVPRFHPELPHNVYLNVFLKSGWIGGFAYLALILATLAFGLRFAFQRTPQQTLFLAAFAGFVALVAIGFLVDTDHWRHFYVNAALVWGLMIARPMPPPLRAAAGARRKARIVGRVTVARNLSPDRCITILGRAPRRVRRAAPLPRRRRDERPRRPQRTAYTTGRDWAVAAAAHSADHPWRPRRAARIVEHAHD